MGNQDSLARSLGRGGNSLKIPLCSYNETMTLVKGESFRIP